LASGFFFVAMAGTQHLARSKTAAAAIFEFSDEIQERRLAPTPPGEMARGVRDVQREVARRHRAPPDTGRNVLMMPMRALSAP
jgi:hypothetical protein